MNSLEPAKICLEIFHFFLNKTDNKSNRILKKILPDFFSLSLDLLRNSHHLFNLLLLENKFKTRYPQDKLKNQINRFNKCGIDPLIRIHA